MVNKKKVSLYLSVLAAVILVNIVLYHISAIRFEDAEEYLLGMDLRSIKDNILLNRSSIILGAVVNTAAIIFAVWMGYVNSNKKDTGSLDKIAGHLQKIIESSDYSPIQDMEADYNVAGLCEKMNIILGNLKDNTLKSRIITEKISIGVSFLDEEGHTKWMNPTGKLILGFDSGRDCSKECDMYWEQCQHFPLKEAIRSGETLQSDVYCDQTDRWFQVNVSPFYDLKNVLSGFVLSFHDITDQYRAQQGLSNIGKIISSSDMIAMVREVHERDFFPVSYISSNVMNVLGYSSNLILSGSVNFDSLIHSDDAQLIQDENIGYMYHTSQEKWVHSPYRLIKKDGSVIWIEDSTTCVRDKDGNPEILRTVLKDVTDEVHSRQHRRQAWKIAKIGYWSYDLQQDKYDLSPETVEILGLPCDKSKLSLDEVLTNAVEDDIEMVKSLVSDSVENNKEMVKAEFRVMLNNQLHYIMFHASNEYNQDGELAGKYGIVQDISFIKEMEIELENERVKYYSVYKYSGDAIIIFDDERNIIDCNNRTLDIFHAECFDDMKSKRFRDISSIEQGGATIISEEIRGMFERIQEKSVCVFEWQFLDCQGEVFPAQVSLTKFILNGKMFYQAIVRDISKELQWREDMEQSRSLAVDALNSADERIMALQRQLNEANNKAKEAEIANHIKSEFLTCMSHEIRTPLNAIIGFTNVLDFEGMSEDNQSYVEQIRVSGKHLLGVINDILDLSKIESGKVMLNREAFALNDLLCHVEMIVHQMVKDKNLDFKIEYCDELPDLMHTDLQHLKQCLINLVANAVKFTREGYVHISVKYVQDESGNDAVEFAVEDTGIGISQENLMSIFEPFVQSSNQDHKAMMTGSGLGLSITKKLTQLMGGNVIVYSELGKGSKFVLTVPVDINAKEMEMTVIS